MQVITPPDWGRGVPFSKDLLPEQGTPDGTPDCGAKDYANINNPGAERYATDKPTEHGPYKGTYP